MRKIWFVVLLMLVSTSVGLCQQDPTTDAGFKPYGSFEGSDIDSVNLANGNVMLHIPIASYPQRGGQLKFNVSARFNNISWTLRSITNPNNPNIVTYYWWLAPGSYGIHVVFDESVQAYELVDSLGIQPSGLNGIQVTSPDGTSHILENIAPSVAGDWQAVDASGYKLHTSIGSNDPAYGITAQGVKSIFTSASNTIQDTNGNQITQATSTGKWTDTMGRVFPQTLGGGLIEGGTYLNGSPIGSYITPGQFVGSTTTDLSGCVGSPSSASLLTLPGYGTTSTTIQIKLCYQSYTLTSNMGGTYVNHLGNTVPINETTTTGSMLHSIYLPDGTSWVFDYDGRGDLSTLTYPTGGTISYAWNTAADIYNGGHIYVASRTLNDGSGPHVWSYTGCNSALGVPTGCTVTDPNSNDTYHGFVAACSTAAIASDFFEAETDFYAGTGSSRTLQRKVAKAYSALALSYWNLSPTLPGCVNVLPKTTTTTLSDVGKVSQTTTTYDTAGGTSLYVWNELQSNSTAYPLTFGLPVSSTATDYGSGSPGAVIRQNATAYQWQSNSNYLTNNLLSRVATSKVLDGIGNLCAETDMFYDQTAPTSSGITKQHVAVTGTLGNLSKTTRQLSATPCQSGASWTPVSATVTVYDTGVPYTVTDPGGHTTTYSYSSTYYGAYLTQTTLPSTSNSSGTFNHKTSAIYDFNTGLVTSYTDQNGNVSNYTYDDMERMVTAVMPDTDSGGNHGETDFYYPDAVTIERKQRLQGSVWTDEYMQLDGLARTSRTMTNNGQSGNSWNQEDICYDSLGRVGFKAYAYQGTGFGTAKVCSGAGDRLSYDALGRAVSVTHSDGTSSTSSYTGAATDSVSEGNGTTALERITQVDALGRLTSVCEVSGSALGGTSGTPSACGQDVAKTGFLTAYAFDALGNVKSASQTGLAARSFTYDSFNRLTTAYNPESGTTTYNWNNDGELISRVRPVANTPGSTATTTTTYAYDQLHRVTGKTYSDGTTPGANFVYDGGTWLGQAVTSGIGHTVYSYTGTSATSPRTADLGFSYDPMGRVLKTRQCLPGHCPTTTYEQDYTYDLLGGTTTATDGLGDTMTWTYTPTGMVTSGDQVVQVQASFSTQPLMSGIQYGPFGMTNVTLGNGHKEVDGYDTRGRLKSIAYNNSSNAAVYSVALNRAPDSSLTSSTDSVNGNWTYGYDGFNRLTSAQATSGSYSGATLKWTYDRYGNRLTQSATGSNSSSVYQGTYSFASNQISGYCYDSAGNLLDETTCAAAGSNHLYKYDAEGRLIATAGYTYEYDAGGTRRSKDNSSGTPTTLYLHDGDGNQIAELNASLAVQHVNVYSGKHLIGTWNPSTSKVYYAYSDWLGTKRYEADSTGTYVNSWTGLPFGDNQTALGTGVDATEHHFTGREHDVESGLDYFKARYYQSQTGRWLLPDWSDTPVPVPYATFTNPQSLNQYTYVGNNPVNQVDADGHLSSGNVTNVQVGSARWQHMTNCNEGLSEPDCLSDQVIPGIMDDAMPPGSSEAYSTYLQQVADSQQVAAPQEPTNGEGSKDNLDRRAAIAAAAASHEGDTSMPYTASGATCNLFVQKAIAESGAPKPLVTKADGKMGAPAAAEWAGNKVPPGWRILKPGEAILPGDVAARKEHFVDATGHSGIVTSVQDGKVTAIAAHATVIGKDMSFQPGSQKYNNVFLRYTGD